MIDLAALLFVAALSVTAARRLNLPSIPLLLLGGWLLSKSGFALSENALAQALELGLMFLVFASGAELDPRRLQRPFGATAAAVAGSAFLQMAATAIPVFFAARLMGYDTRIALTFGVAFSASSTLVVTGQLRRFGQTQEPFALYATRLLLVQDLAMILLLAGLAALSSGGAAVALALAKVAALAVPAAALQVWGLPRLLTGRRFAEETLLLFWLASLFLFLAGAAFLGLPLVVGAFFAGIVFSRFPANALIRGQVSTLTDFFAALFFVTLGQLAPAFGEALIGKALLLAGLVLLTRPLATFFLARRSGLQNRASAEAGLLLSQVSEYALVVALLAAQSGVFTGEELALAGLVTALTMAVTPAVAGEKMASRLLHLRLPGRLPPPPGAWRDHVVLVGYGAGGKWVLKPLVDAGIEVVVVDDDAAVAESLRTQDIPCVLGNGADAEVLEAASANRARLVLASPRRVSDALAVLRHVSGPPVMARVFEQADADRVRQLGGIPILNSLAGAERFLEWFRLTQETGADNESSGNFKERVNERSG